MCTKLNNGNRSNKNSNHNPTGTNQTEINFSLIDKLSGTNISSIEITKQFPCLMEFVHNANMIALTCGQMAVIQCHYESERKARKVNLNKISEFPIIRIKPQNEDGTDEAGFVYIRFLKKSKGSIIATIYSALPFNRPMYVEEFYTCGLSKPKTLYINPLIRENPDFLEDIQGELRVFCVSVLSFIESYPEFCYKNTERYRSITIVKPFKYVRGYSRNENHVCGYFRHM